MTEQQQHLKELLEKRASLQRELELLQVEANSKKEVFLKIQGIIEYLAQLGVTLPEEQKEQQKETVENESVSN